MIRTTFYKLKKACYTLTLAPRVLLRGEMRFTPGKFQKLSITVLRRAEKSTASGSDKDEECEKCKKLIELIFGPSNPEAMQGLNKTELPETDIHLINETHNEKLAQIITPQVHDAKAHSGMSNRVISEKFGTEEVLEKTDMPIETHIHATAAKQTEEQLAQKLEVVNETPVVEAEIPKTDGFNVRPKVLGNAEEIQSFHNHDSRKWDEFDDIRVHAAKPETVVDNIKMRDTIENLVRKIEETYRLEDLRKQEDFRRVERALSKEIERSDFKLPIHNFSSDGQNRKSGASGAAAETNTYDEVAKRCLDAPNSKIDERILKEMEKLGVPQTSSRGESSVIEENIIQIDLKKPRKPGQKTEIDLETREFERDPPIAYIDKHHPAFQTANCSKSVLDEDPNMNNLTSERVQAHELDNNDKPLTYSENVEDECVNFESKPYDTSRVIIDPYDKRSIALDNEEEEYDPLWYERYTIRQEKELDMNKDGEPSEMQPDANNAITYTSDDQAQYLQTGTKQDSFTDQSRDETEPYVAVESKTIEQLSENVTNPIYQNKTPIDQNASESEKYSFKHEHVAAVAAETNLKEDEIIQLSVLIDPDEAGRVTSEPHDSFDSKKASITPERASMKFEKASIEPEKTSVEFERSPIGHKNDVEPERGSNESERTFVQPHTASQMYERYQNYIQPPMQTIDPNATKENVEYQHHLNTPPLTPSMNTPKHPDETYKFITRPELSPTFDPTKNHNAGYENTVSKILPESLTQTKPFQYSTPPETASNTKQDVTYMEPKAPEESLEKPARENPNLTPEQISHSFVQPQSMVNPLNSQLEEPSEKIQKTMSACNMPNLKPQEEISLSEMLKRVRLRNQIEYCQAIDRQVGQLEPVTGKCGKKTPPCPPPAPKCPQCPPPPCPPPPPPCPKPCKPACPPPCPPPCPAPKKDPCSKFKKHVPGINLQSIITMLLQSSDLRNPESLNLCVRISERSHTILVRKMSLKLQEIGLNLLIVYPRKIDVKLPSKIGETVTLARDYEPWVPIPSWPIPKKEVRRPFVCPKEGCKLIPPPKLRPPCNGNPCINFPKRSNSFSVAQLFSLFLGDNVEFDIIN